MCLEHLRHACRVSGLWEALGKILSASTAMHGPLMQRGIMTCLNKRLTNQSKSLFKPDREQIDSCSVATNQETTCSGWTKDIRPILPERLDFPSAIGLFLLNFGTLEYLVFVFLKDRLTTEEFLKVREWHFKDRVTRIARYIEDSSYPAEQQTAFTRLLCKVDEIRELRNHIAHGHMLCRIDADTQKPMVTVFKAKDVNMAYFSESKHLKFSELCTALTTLAEVIEEFQRLAEFKPTS